jgi:predicted NBD/HSP70 family sugar kinase
MLIGIDWGGTKIEGVALTEDGKELTRRREPTPRHDYNGCVQLIAGLVQKIEQVEWQSTDRRSRGAVSYPRIFLRVLLVSLPETRSLNLSKFHQAAFLQTQNRNH